jgi:peptidyl-prolyl cis-trans isomerase D
VNGKSIDRMEFENNVLAVERQQQGPVDEATRDQIRSSMWDQAVNEIIMNEEYDKLGLTVTDKEMRDMIISNPPQNLRQQFTDEKGNYNGSEAQKYLDNARKDPIQRQQVDKFFEYLKSQRLMSKYMTLMTNSIYFPKWILEKRNVDNSLIAKISYVTVPYATIPDSTIKVTDDEIKDYLDDHKDQFEQKVEKRSISYVQFSAAPSSADSAETKNSLIALKSSFASAPDPVTFFAQQETVIPYFNGYLSKNAIQVPQKDSILALPKGSIYGPYLDVNQNANTALYVLAKMIDSKSLPDSVKCRHILLGTMDRQGRPLMPDSVAKAKADSIASAIKNGASFDLLDSLYSTDEAAKRDKGVMTFSSTDIQGEGFAKEFGQFILFDGKPGDKKVVKTQFGWHYIEILDHKNVQPHYKIAYLAKRIFTSDKTESNALNQANLFAGDSRDLASFNSNYEKNLRPLGISRLTANDISPMDNTFQGSTVSSRPFIKKVFDTDKGDVIGPEKVGDNFIVAIVTEVNKPGLPSVNSVRTSVEPLLRNRKKSEQIIKKIGQVTSLEQTASKVGQQVQTVDSLRFGGGSNLGYEPKVTGAAFNSAYKGKVIPQAIAGTSGVFVIRIDNTSTTPVETANIQEQQKMLEMRVKQDIMNQMQQQNMNPVIEPLKNAANVKDNRAKFY